MVAPGDLIALAKRLQHLGHPAAGKGRNGADLQMQHIFLHIPGFLQVELLAQLLQLRRGLGPHIPQQPAIEHLIVLHGIPPGAPPDQYLQTDFCNIFVIGVNLLAGRHELQAIIIQCVFIGQPDQAVIDHQLSVFQIVPALDDILQKVLAIVQAAVFKKVTPEQG